METFWVIVLLLTALAGITLRKAYYVVPPAELKRLARTRDPLASRLNQAVAYGGSLRVLLWLIIALSSAGAFILLSRHFETWQALLVIAVFLWVAFSWLPASRASGLADRLAWLATPGLVWLLKYLRPVLGRTGWLERQLPPRHTGLFERSDLLALLERQGRQPNNRLTAQELEIVKRSLEFQERKVADVLIPKAKVKIVKPGDTVGPILIDEIHKTGHGFALVRESAKEPFAGTLALSRLDIRASGTARNLMDPAVGYVNQNEDLNDVLQAFFVTGQPVFVAVSATGKYAGIVTVKDVLRQLLGGWPAGDPDRYASPEAATSVKTDEDVVESPS